MDAPAPVQDLISSSGSNAEEFRIEGYVSHAGGSALGYMPRARTWPKASPG